MISRREFLGTSLGAGAALALTDPLRAFESQSGRLMQRAIPSSGEMVPVVSFGARPAVTPGGRVADVPAMKQILKTLLDNGGRVADVMHGGPMSEDGARQAAAELGIQNRLFWTTPLSVNVPAPPGSPAPPKPDAAAVRAHVEGKLTRFKVPMIDLVMVGAGGDASMAISVLRDMKKEGKLRYIGVHDLATPPYPPGAAFDRLEALMRNEPIDFVGTDYIAGWAGVEAKLLPLALERKIAFMAYFPFDRGRIFKRASDAALPEWAAEFDASTFPQLFLKYVLSHPAVIMARTGTTNPAHMLENLNAGMGRLPTEAMRTRIAQLVDTFPPQQAPAPAPQPPSGPVVSLSPAVLDRYVGEYATASGFVAVFRREGDKLIVKPGSNPEAPLISRSETRFQDPRGPFFEFQIDAQGKVTGAVLEQQTPKGPQKIPLTRK